MARLVSAISDVMDGAFTLGFFVCLRGWRSLRNKSEAGLASLNWLFFWL